MERRLSADVRSTTTGFESIWVKTSSRIARGSLALSVIPFCKTALLTFYGSDMAKRSPKTQTGAEHYSAYQSRHSVHLGCGTREGDVLSQKRRHRHGVQLDE